MPYVPKSISFFPSVQHSSHTHTHTTNTFHFIKTSTSATLYLHIPSQVFTKIAFTATNNIFTKVTNMSTFTYNTASMVAMNKTKTDETNFPKDPSKFCPLSIALLPMLTPFSPGPVNIGFVEE